MKIVADQLRKRLRGRDFIARFGGEEFVLLLPQTSPADAAQIAEVLRATVEACPFHFKGERVVITTSIGLVHSVPVSAVTGAQARGCGAVPGQGVGAQSRRAGIAGSR